jgi:GntR family transcriptional regulator/MocR family aminotransferase
MTDRWANFGLDLHLELASTGRTRSLENALRSAIREGRLASGTRLPASRVLAGDLGVARNSVAEVYGQLVAEGWLESRTGAGTWVSERPASRDRVIRPREQTVALLDLRGGIPDPSSFPRAEWAAATRRALASADAAELGYTHPQGVEHLRAALAEYLTRARGVWAGPDDIVVARGFGDLLSLTANALRARGATRIAVEEYGHETHRAILAAAGLTVIPIPVDGQGAVVAALEGSGADAVLLTPAHQFPTGVPLCTARRIEVTRWAERTGALIIEDDYDGEFRYDRRSIGALQALAPEHVMYVGTASKSLAPTLGLAWAASPGSLVPQLLEQRRLRSCAAGGLNQLVLAEFMRVHHYDRHLRQVRARYHSRRQQLEAVVGALEPACRVTGLAAGLHCLVELPPTVSERAVEEQAAARGVLLHGLSFYLARGRTPERTPSMVVGYGAPTHVQFPSAVSAAGAAIAASLAA